MGYSALVGLAVLVLGFPVQFLLVKMMFAQRKKGVVLTDQRVRLTTEVRRPTFFTRMMSSAVIQVLQGIRLIKYYAWEQFYVHQIGTLRERELGTVRRLAYVVSYFRT